MIKKFICILCFIFTILAPDSFAEIRDFSHIDKVISNLPPTHNMHDVINAININAKDDWEKARGVYIWISGNIDYDVDSFFRGATSPTNTDDTFRSRKAVCFGYATLYSEMAHMLGLETKTIEGFAKGYAYKTGNQFDQANHAWNAVKLDDSWHLIDATWGAGFVEQRNFVRDFSDIWFDMDPRLFIYNHLPEEKKWTLIDQSISLDDYVQTPLLEAAVLQRLINMGFKSDHIYEISNQLPLPPLFEFFSNAFLKNGGHPIHMINFLKQGEIPSMWSYNNYPTQLINYPTEGVLKSEKQYEFSVRIENTERVIVSNNGDFTVLDRKGNIFSGKIKAKPGTLKLSADISHENTQSYWPLIAWKVE